MTEVAIRYSNACIRAALAALILAAISVSIANKLSMSETLDWARAYIVNRNILDEALEDIVSSEYWPHIIKALDRDVSTADTITLAELQSVVCMRNSNGTRAASAPSRKQVNTERSAQVAGDSQATSPSAPVPMAPTLSTTTKERLTCPAMDWLQASFNYLWNDDLLMIGQDFSEESREEINEWRRKRDLPNFKPPAKRKPDPRITLGRLKELNALPKRTITEFDKVEREFMSSPSLYWSERQPIHEAALFAELGLLVFVAYFFVNYHAARLAHLLDAPGSLFQACWATLVGRVFYCSMLLLPATVALHLASKMDHAYWHFIYLVPDRRMGLGIASITAFLTLLLFISFLRENISIRQTTATVKRSVTRLVQRLRR